MKRSLPILILFVILALFFSSQTTPSADSVTSCGAYDEIQKYPLQLKEGVDYGSLHLKIRNLTSAKGDLYRWCAEVYKNGNTSPIQTIQDSCDDEFGCISVSRGDIYHTDDINFDGYLDIYFLAAAGATGNTTYDYWTYDPEKSNFEYSEDYSEVFTPTFDKENKQVRSHWKGGAAGGAYNDSIFKVENGKLVLLQTIEQDSTDRPGVFKRTTEDYEDGKVVSSKSEDVRFD